MHPNRDLSMKTFQKRAELEECLSKNEAGQKKLVEANDGTNFIKALNCLRHLSTFQNVTVSLLKVKNAYH